LFVNTRSDLGECKKIHDEELRRQWDACTEKEKFRYEDEYIRYLEKLVADLERKMKKSQSTLNRRKTKDENNLMDSAQLEQLDKRSEELFKTMAKYSEENQLEEANKTMAELEELKKQKKELTDKIESGSQEKRMELCQICGAYLVIGDTEKRISSHLDGKQHKGYEMIRNRIDEHYSNKETERKKKEKRNIKVVQDLIHVVPLILPKKERDQGAVAETEKNAIEEIGARLKIKKNMITVITVKIVIIVTTVIIATTVITMITIAEITEITMIT